VENAEGKRGRGGRGGRGEEREEGEEEKEGEEGEARPRWPVTADSGYQGYVCPAPRPAVQGLSPESADSGYPESADLGYQGWVWPAPRFKVSVQNLQILVPRICSFWIPSLGQPGPGEGGGGGVQKVEKKKFSELGLPGVENVPTPQESIFIISRAR